MNNITLKQLRSDFYYLQDNLSPYYETEDTLINNILPGLISGKYSTKDLILWSIKDIIFNTIYKYKIEDEEFKNEDDIEFLKNDKRAVRILNRYDIEIKL